MFKSTCLSLLATSSVLTTTSATDAWQKNRNLFDFSKQADESERKLTFALFAAIILAATVGPSLADKRLAVGGGRGHLGCAAGRLGGFQRSELRVQQVASMCNHGVTKYLTSLFVVEAASEEQQAWLGQHCLVSVQQVA